MVGVVVKKRQLWVLKLFQSVSSFCRIMQFFRVIRLFSFVQSRSYFSILVVIVTGLALSACGGVEQPKNSACATPADMVLSDINSVVEWINAMEKPLELSCFVESLPRPLKVNNSTDELSAQPALGVRSPRIFFMYDPLILTVSVDKNDVPGGSADDHDLLEMSYITDKQDMQSIKAELAFPVLENLAPSAPYKKVKLINRDASSCIFCHFDEVQVDTVEGVPVYQSMILAPISSITIAEIIVENITCHSELEPKRCRMLSALVDHGELVWEDFPEGSPTRLD